jgi:soluble lytic murein transglycosylase
MCIFIPVGFAASLSDQRSIYKEARQLQLQGKWALASLKARQLSGYALEPYLDYYLLRHRLSSVEMKVVDDYRRRHANSPLADALERRYLEVLAQKKKWRAFLDFYPNPPVSVVLKCHHYVAELNVGDKSRAWLGAQELWLSGSSQPKACDPLFEAFSQSGLLTDALIWQRMQLAFAAGKPSLLGYLNRQLKSDYTLAGQSLALVYRKPSKLAHRDLFDMSQPGMVAVIGHGLLRLAWRDAQLAQQIYLHYEKDLEPLPELKHEVRVQLVRAIIDKPTGPLLIWADSELRTLDDGQTLERRLRLALARQQWAQIRQFIPLLPHELASKDRWQYWQARALAQSGEIELARESLAAIASERSYYGFLAAQRLEAPYNLNGQRLADTESIREQLSAQPGFVRARELMAVKEAALARQEWQSLLSTADYTEKLMLGELALAQDWPDLAVQAAIKAQAWDELELRFPIAYGGLFEQFAKLRQIDSYLLLAMARQESALNSAARSPVGARGLMQLMPATATQTARQINFRYSGSRQLFRPEVNIRLGSAYLQGLMDQYDHQRYLAAAAYNAGPNRVERWRRERGGLPADIWIETIPYRETRDYVKNVLAYHLIYSVQAGKPRELFDEHEFN